MCEQGGIACQGEWGRTTSYNIQGGRVKTRISFVICTLAGVFLFSACSGSTAVGPTSTPDPMLMNFNERTIWDFENYREEINDLAGLAAETPVEDLDPIVHQISALAEEIKEYDYPLSAAQTHSALYNYAEFTFQCYVIKYQVHITEMSDEEYHTFFGDFDRCERAQEYKETFDLYLQELKGANAGD